MFCSEFSTSFHKTFISPLLAKISACESFNTIPLIKHEQSSLSVNSECDRFLPCFFTGCIVFVCNDDTIGRTEVHFEPVAQLTTQSSLSSFDSSLFGMCLQHIIAA